MNRGLALFLGAFTLLNLLGDSRFDANLWWIDLWPLPHGVAVIVLIAFSIAMIAFASGVRNEVTNALTIVILIFSIANTIRYYVLFLRADFHTQFPVPLSLCISISLSLILRNLPGPTYAGFAIATLTCRASR